MAYIPWSSNANTPFTPDPNLTGQLTGTGNPLSNTTAITWVSAGNTSITQALSYTRFISTTTASGNSTFITSNGVLPAGALVHIQVNNDATAPRLITFGTGFRSNGTQAGTNSKASTFVFVSDGTTLNEFARSGPI